MNGARRTARSFLFVPANDARKIAKALNAAADALIFDLEDAVPVDGKAEARRVLERALAEADAALPVPKESAAQPVSQVFAVAPTSEESAAQPVSQVFAVAPTSEESAAQPASQVFAASPPEAAEQAEPLRCVRINGVRTPHWREDVDLCRRLGIACVMLPKAETPEQIRLVVDRWSAGFGYIVPDIAGPHHDASGQNGSDAAASDENVPDHIVPDRNNSDDVAPADVGPNRTDPAAVSPKLSLLALVETATGVENAYAIAGADPAVERLAFGAVDLALELELPSGGGEEVLAYARSRLTIASRAAGTDRRGLYGDSRRGRPSRRRAPSPNERLLGQNDRSPQARSNHRCGLAHRSRTARTRPPDRRGVRACRTGGAGGDPGGRGNGGLPGVPAGAHAAGRNCVIRPSTKKNAKSRS